MGSIRTEKSQPGVRPGDQVKNTHAGNELQASYRFLEIANQQTEMEPLLNEFIHEIQKITGCEAVGIRILDGDGHVPRSVAAIAYVSTYPAAAIEVLVAAVVRQVIGSFLDVPDRGPFFLCRQVEEVRAAGESCLEFGRQNVDAIAGQCPQRFAIAQSIDDLHGIADSLL